MILLALLLGTTPAVLPHGSPRPGAFEWSAHPYSIDEILDAIRSVETGGEREGGRHATGDGGRAIGPYQIHEEHWLDTRLAGRHEDCRDPLYARREVIAYWARWCPEALERRDAEVLARVHNGGPNGRAKESTLAYWVKARTRLEEARATAGVTIAEAVPPAAARPGKTGRVL